ncbi:MAG: cardiolipin synthase [Opitutaceae bacterium]
MSLATADFACDDARWTGIGLAQIWGETGGDFPSSGGAGCALVSAMWWILMVGWVVGLAVVPRILLQKKSPVSTLAWIWAVLLFPYFGALVYFVFGAEQIRRQRLRRREQFRAHRERDAGPAADDAALEEIVRSLPEPDRALLTLVSRINRLPPAAGNATALLEGGVALYADLIAAIDGAREHVHVMFYIWRDDAAAGAVLEALVRAAERGLEVRLLLDEIGCLFTPTRTFNRLRDAGGEFAWFLTLIPERKLLLLNLRNHRKLVVVDGRKAWLGGMNVGEEYAGGTPEFPVWRDVQVRLTGPAVTALQEIFADDWFFATKLRLVAPRFYPEVAPDATGGIVQLVSGGPDNRVSEHGLTVVALLHHARERAWLASPYLVPDAALLDALTLAVLRGVEVRLLVPARSDHTWLTHVTRSFYDELFAKGVRVFEFQPGMLHSKLVTIDGRWSMIGSANLDIRSFRLNYELNALVLSEGRTREVEAIFARDFAESRERSAREFARRPRLQKLIEAALRPFAPLL